MERHEILDHERTQALRHERHFHEVYAKGLPSATNPIG